VIADVKRCSQRRSDPMGWAMKAIEQLRSGLTVGHAHTAMHGTRRGTVGQVVHDGDTIALDPLGGLSVRFLGVDAPEVSFTTPRRHPRSLRPITDEASGLEEASSLTTPCRLPADPDVRGDVDPRGTGPPLRPQVGDIGLSQRRFTRSFCRVSDRAR
jgi:hypothetical protein